MKETVLRLIRERDTFAAIEYLSEHGDPLVVTRAFSESMQHLYWQERKLQYSVAMGRAGIQFALTRTRECDQETADQMRGLAQVMAYNIGSFCWPGWNETDIRIFDTDLAAGRDAARTNLRLVREARKGELGLSRAMWLVGAYHIAYREWDQARSAFAKAADHADRAISQADALLNRAYELLPGLILEPEGEFKPKFDSLLADLVSAPHGESMCKDARTALAVFQAREPKAGP